MLHERAIANSDSHKIIDAVPFHLAILSDDGDTTLHTFPKGLFKIGRKAERQITL